MIAYLWKLHWENNCDADKKKSQQCVTISLNIYHG